MRPAKRVPPIEGAGGNLLTYSPPPFRNANKLISYHRHSHRTGTGIGINPNKLISYHRHRYHIGIMCRSRK
jgi:hypothetical protein